MNAPRLTAPRLKAPRLILAGTLCAASLAPVATAADVITVDAAGGAAFTDIEAAIAAAQDGDTLLVQPGNYPLFLVLDKALAIVGDGAGLVHIQGGARVANLSPGKHVLLQNLTVHGVASETHFAGHGVNLIDNAGGVRIEDCVLIAADNVVEPADCQGYSSNEGWNAARIEGCASVVIADSVLQAGRGVIQSDELMPFKSCGFWTQGGNGGYGVYAVASNVALYGCDVRGGQGGVGGWGGYGGPGYLGSDGTLFAAGTTIEGGDGGLGFDFLAGPGGDGGHGIFGSPAFSARLFDVVTLGGAGGPSEMFDEGNDGPPTSGGDYTVESGPARRLDVASPVRVGAPFTLDFQGEPQDLVFLIVSGVDVFIPLPEYHGTLLSLPAASLSLGFLDAQGELSLPLALAPLGGSPDALTFVLQGFHVSPTLDLVIGSGAHLVALDPGF